MISLVEYQTDRNIKSMSAWILVLFGGVII